MLGFGGHFATKSRRYSTAHKNLRAPAGDGPRRRADWWNRHHRDPQHLDQVADVDTDTTLIVADLTLAGIG